MAKLSKQDKINIYNNWKYYGISLVQLGKEYGVVVNNLGYMCKLIDKYGLQVLDYSYTVYSIEFKQTAINRILKSEEPIDQNIVRSCFAKQRPALQLASQIQRRWV